MLEEPPQQMRFDLMLPPRPEHSETRVLDLLQVLHHRYVDISCSKVFTVAKVISTMERFTDTSVPVLDVCDSLIIGCDDCTSIYYLIRYHQCKEVFFLSPPPPLTCPLPPEPGPAACICWSGLQAA